MCVYHVKHRRGPCVLWRSSNMASISGEAVIKGFFSFESSPPHSRRRTSLSQNRTCRWRMSFSEKQRANGVHTNNCGLIRIAQQEKANDVMAFSTVVVLENASRLRDGIKHMGCVPQMHVAELQLRNDTFPVFRVYS